MKLDRCGKKIRLAIIGYGQRSRDMTDLLMEMPDVEISSICDIVPERLAIGVKAVEEKQGSKPYGSLVSKACIDREDVDAVIIYTCWEEHINIALEALECGKRVAMEVGGSNSVDECWRLVRKSEETGIPVMLLENCCYGETEMTLLNMIRKNVFGTLLHCEGAYAHDLREEIGNGDVTGHYRQRHFLHRNGELYPTHELGPIASYLNINHGNRMISLVSMASKACGLHEWFMEKRSDKPELQCAQINQGDVVTTLIRCANGETIILKHDCTLPRPYSRGGVVRGTKGIWQEDNRSIFIEGRSPVNPEYWTHEWEKDEKYMKEYRHPVWEEYHRIGVRGSHDGMDYLVLRSFIESVQDQTEPPIDVYDLAAWMSITALSEQSIACGSIPIAIPDFTGGRWLQPRIKRCKGTFALFEN